MLAYLRLEVARQLRNPRLLLFTVAMPLVMYLIFTNIGIGDDQTEEPAVAVGTMVGMACYGAVWAAIGIVPGIVNERVIGWLRQLRVTPLPPARVVAVKLLTGVVVVAPAVVAVCVAAALVNGVHLTSWQWVALVGLLWLGAAPFALLGLGIGYGFGPQTSSMVGMTTVIGMSVLGGLWLPVSLFPTALQYVGRALPTNRYAELGWQVAAGHAPPLAGVGILLAWCAAFGVFAVLAYRRAGRA